MRLPGVAATRASEGDKDLRGIISRLGSIGLVVPRTMDSLRGKSRECSESYIPFGGSPRGHLVEFNLEVSISPRCCSSGRQRSRESEESECELVNGLLGLVGGCT